LPARRKSNAPDKDLYSHHIILKGKFRKGNTCRLNGIIQFVAEIASKLAWAPIFTLEVGSNFVPNHPFKIAPMTTMGRDEGLAPWPRTKEVISDQLCEYYGLAAQMDPG
jgi:hypothetical protein